MNQDPFQSDPRLLQLQRDAAEGDLMAQAQLLEERVNRGILSRYKLPLMSYLGDPAAKLVLGPEAPKEADLLDEWVLGMGAWGKETSVRAAIAAAWSTLPVWEHERPQMVQPRRAVELAQDWVVCPCEAHLQAARVSAGAAAWDAAAGVTNAARAAANAASGSARTVLAEADHARAASATAKDAAKAYWTATAVPGAADKAVRNVICNELLPWVLGVQDVIKDRVQNRGRASGRHPRPGSGRHPGMAPPGLGPQPGMGPPPGPGPFRRTPPPF